MSYHYFGVMTPYPEVIHYHKTLTAQHPGVVLYAFTFFLILSYFFYRKPRLMGFILDMVIRSDAT